MKRILNSFIVFVALVFCFCVPAGAGQLKIETGPGWMKGNADAVSLEEVLSQVAGKTGCDIFIDEEIADAKTSFRIDENLSLDRAIRRMVRPHSYAVVFGGDEKGSKFAILEVWVFRKGAERTASYVSLRGADHSASSSVGAGSTGAGSSSAASASGAGRTIEGKNILRRDFTVTKSPFGTPVIKYRDKSKSPDYRPNSLEMKQAYQRYQQEKAEAIRRRNQSAARQARRAFEQDMERRRAERNEEIRKQIMEMKEKSKQ